MKIKKVLTILLFCILSLMLHAQDISSGQLILIEGNEHFEIFAADKKLGETPLLYTHGSAGRLEIEIRHQGRSIKQNFIINPAIRTLTKWTPQLPEKEKSWSASAPAAEQAPSGESTVTLEAIPQKATILLNGEAVELPDVKKLSSLPVTLASGFYLMQVSAPGRDMWEGLLHVKPNSDAVSFVIPKLQKSRLSPAVGWLTIAAGLGMAIGGAVVNSESFAVQNSTANYSTYQTLKYSGLAGMGLGAITTGVGLLLLR